MRVMLVLAIKIEININVSQVVVIENQMLLKGATTPRLERAAGSNTKQEKRKEHTAQLSVIKGERALGRKQNHSGGSFFFLSLSLSLYIYIYIYIVPCYPLDQL